MIARLSEALQLPMTVQNQLLTQAGFATRFACRGLDDKQMAPIRAAMARMLAQHMPYPAMSYDADWTVLAMNPAAATLYGVFGFGVGGNLLDLLMRPQVQAAVENWPQLAHVLAQRLRTESAARGGNDRFDQVACALNADVQNTDVQSLTDSPVVPLTLRIGDARLSMFATIAQFGTPTDITLDALHVELYFPMDAESDQFLHQLAA